MRTIQNQSREQLCNSTGCIQLDVYLAILYVSTVLTTLGQHTLGPFGLVNTAGLMAAVSNYYVMLYILNAPVLTAIKMHKARMSKHILTIVLCSSQTPVLRLPTAFGSLTLLHFQLPLLPLQVQSENHHSLLSPVEDIVMLESDCV